MHKPLCPDCDSELERRRFVDTWDSEGNPEDVNEDWYCPHCKVRWVREKEGFVEE